MYQMSHNVLEWTTYIKCLLFNLDLFLDGKTNPRKHNIHGPRRHDIAMHDLLDSM